MAGGQPDEMLLSWKRLVTTYVPLSAIGGPRRTEHCAARACRLHLRVRRPDLRQGQSSSDPVMGVSKDCDRPSARRHRARAWDALMLRREGGLD
jgi:hypothetical protein